MPFPHSDTCGDVGIPAQSVCVDHPLLQDDLLLPPGILCSRVPLVAPVVVASASAHGPSDEDWRLPPQVSRGHLRVGAGPERGRRRHLEPRQHHLDQKGRPAGGAVVPGAPVASCSSALLLLGRAPVPERRGQREQCEVSWVYGGARTGGRPPAAAPPLFAAAPASPDRRGGPPLSSAGAHGRPRGDVGGHGRDVPRPARERPQPDDRARQDGRGGGGVVPRQGRKQAAGGGRGGARCPLWRERVAHQRHPVVGGGLSLSALPRGRRQDTEEKGPALMEDGLGPAPAYQVRPGPWNTSSASRLFFQKGAKFSANMCQMCHNRASNRLKKDAPFFIQMRHIFVSFIAFLLPKF